jgi:hypothetical protein
MMRFARIIAATAGLALAAALLIPEPVSADGAASTRNIIIGGAAAAAGALILINHNKQVHAKYAADAQQQAALQAQNADMQSAYNSERQAYLHEVALVNEYKKEVAYQHQVVVEQGAQLGQLGVSPATGFVQNAPLGAKPAPAAPQVVSYGWGTF